MNRRNRKLPLRLYYVKARDGFKYRRPDGKEFWMGRDEEAAKKAANELNAQYASELVNKVSNTGFEFKKFIERYIAEIYLERKLSPITQKDYDQKLVHIKAKLGSISISKIDVIECADFLDEFKPTQSNRYRALLSLLFRYAVAKGYRKGNPALETIPKREEVKRGRLTLADFQEIRTKAAPEIRNAMDLALHTLQRREDIADMKRADIANGVIQVIQKKTGAAIKIHMGAALSELVQRCKPEGSATTIYILHKDLNKLSRESLSRGFQKARDQIGRFRDMPKAEKPTFHEIRALGARLYQEAGVGKTEIQKLLGHSQEKQTDVYLSRHEVKWIEVVGGLSVAE